MLNLFNNPPNPAMSPKNYKGQNFFIEPSYLKQIYHLDKSEEIRKFRLSNLKDKSLLF